MSAPQIVLSPSCSFQYSLSLACSPICLDRIDIIKQACGVFRILGEDALSVMYTLNRASEREEALMAMFAKMAGR